MSGCLHKPCQTEHDMTLLYLYHALRLLIASLASAKQRLVALYVPCILWLHLILFPEPHVYTGFRIHASSILHPLLLLCHAILVAVYFTTVIVPFHESILSCSSVRLRTLQFSCCKDIPIYISTANSLLMATTQYTLSGASAVTCLTLLCFAAVQNRWYAHSSCIPTLAVAVRDAIAIVTSSCGCNSLKNSRVLLQS